MFHPAVPFLVQFDLNLAYLWVHISIYGSVGGWRAPFIASCVTIYRLIGMLEYWTLEIAIIGIAVPLDNAVIQKISYMYI